MTEKDLKNYELKAAYLDSLGQTATAKDILDLVAEVRRLTEKNVKLNEKVSSYLLSIVNI